MPIPAARNVPARPWIARPRPGGSSSLRCEGVTVPFLAPDVLVLASGGTLGEAWMSGVLAGIEDASGHDFRRAESFIGTSACSLVAAALVAGQRPRRPTRAPGMLQLESGAS